MATIDEKIEKAMQRKKIVELLKEGNTINQIQKKFPQVSKMQIAAYKAHITMGTYK